MSPFYVTSHVHRIWSSSLCVPDYNSVHKIYFLICVVPMTILSIIFEVLFFVFQLAIVFIFTIFDTGNPKSSWCQLCRHWWHRRCHQWRQSCHHVNSRLSILCSRWQSCRWLLLLVFHKTTSLTSCSFCSRWQLPVAVWPVPGSGAMCHDVLLGVYGDRRGHQHRRSPGGRHQRTGYVWQRPAKVSEVLYSRDVYTCHNSLESTPP